MAKTIKYRKKRDNSAIVEDAVASLDAGFPVAIPTETVYGLACDATNSESVKRVYSAKGRPSHNPLIIHVSDRDMAERYVRIPALADRLMQHFWPGPLTFVLPQTPDNGISPEVSAGLDTLAVRCPAHSAAREIIGAFNRPVAAPSANPSGKLSPVTAHDVDSGLGDRIPLIIDGGKTDVGIESTIISIEDDTLRLLRPGSITAEDITVLAGVPVLGRDNTKKITAPGQLASHYAPDAQLLINCDTPAGDVHIGFGIGACAFNLSPQGSLAEAANNLFSTLRTADMQARGGTISVAPIPNHSIGIAINDRLRRAAAPRPQKDTQ